MKSSFLFLVLSLSTASALAQGYDPSSFPSYQSIPAMARPWFAHLAKSIYSPSELAKLAKVPSAEPAMVELMQRIINDPNGNPELLHCVIKGIYARDDFSEEHQAWLRELLMSKLGRTNGFMESILKIYGPSMFRKYPNEANEKLLIDYLDDKDVLNVVPGSLDTGHSACAMYELQFIGTERALKPLQKYAERYKPKPGEESNWLYNDTMQSIAAIEEREKQRRLKAPGQESLMAEHSQSKQNQTSGKMTNPPATSMARSLLALAALAILLISWQVWFWSKRRR